MSRESNDAVFLKGFSGNASIVGNVMAHASSAIGTGAGAAGIKIWHNTIVANAATGVIASSASAVDLRNNILANNGAYGASGADSKFSDQDYNLFFANGTADCNSCTLGTHSVQTDPLFTNAASDDYTLKVGSPALNAGTSLGADRNGASAGTFNGSAPDLGAWEGP